MNRLIVFSLLVFVFHHHHAQEVEGIVTDSRTGEGLIGAHVYLLSDWRIGTITGINGAFELDIDVSYKDSLVVTYVGFQERIVPLDSRNIALASVELKGNEVIIEAKPLVAEEFKYVKLKKLDIYTNPTAKADPILAVNTLPSATTTDESANISLRGSSPIETGIFLNNVPIYDGVRYTQLNGIGTFSIFNTSIMKDVTVFPGNPPLEYGNTTSGAVVLTTDDQILEDNGNAIILSMANLGISRDQKINENQSLRLFTNWQPSGFFKAINNESLSEIQSFESVDLGAYWYGATEKIAWKAMSYSLIDGYTVDFQHPSFQGPFKQNRQRSLWTGSIERILKNGNRLSLNMALNGSNGDFSYSNVSFNLKKWDSYAGLNYLVSREKYTLKYGLSFDRRASTVDGVFHTISYALGEGSPTIYRHGTNRSELLEVFAYGKHFISDKLSVGSGMRSNIPLKDQPNDWAGQLNMAFSDGPWILTGGFGKYYKWGLLEESGSPFAAQSQQVSIDIKYEKSLYQFALSYFDKSNRINEGAYEASGLELLTHYSINKLKLSGSLTVMETVNRRVVIEALDVRYFFRASAAYQPGRFWTLEGLISTREGTTYHPVSSARLHRDLGVFEPIFSDNIERLPGYTNLSISVSKVFPVSEKMNMIGFFNMNNLINRENVRALTYNFDYTVRIPSLFSKRIAYAGIIVNF